MTKKEMCYLIAKAYFPPSYPDDCGVKQGFIAQKMRMSKKRMEAIYELALDILEGRVKKEAK